MSREAEAVEAGESSASTIPARITLSLSGGGYRATAFAAGALLAVADSSLRTGVTSVSSVSGGSLTSAITVGGFANPGLNSPDPIGQRVRLLAGLVQSRAIRTEYLVSRAKALAVLIAVGLLALFVDSSLLSNEDYLLMYLALMLIIASVTLSAFPTSWYAVQSTVETLVGHGRGSLSSQRGTTLADIAQEESTRRIFCATDLSSGSHVYLTPGCVLSPGETGQGPNLFLADVVAASACFPGLRPVVFKRAELGLSTSAVTGEPHCHRAGGRFLTGTVGSLGIGTILAAFVMRMVGPLDGPVKDGLVDLVLSLALLVFGVSVAVLCARVLWVRDDNLTLVDGGVCDNLGAAFALLSGDDRYPELPGLAGADRPGLMLVVDASKPFALLKRDWRGLGELIPLRLRGAQRSVLQLLGNANAMARKHIIALVLKSEGPTTGAVVSLSDVPAPSDGLDWPTVVERSMKVKTTLDALTPDAVHSLMLQAYRLTQASLVEYGAELTRVRSAEDVSALVEKPATERVTALLEEGRGPYARRSLRVRSTHLWLTVITMFFLVIFVRQ
ncbi:hypothetical protein [Streptomyces sp. NPDC092307]|uniref:hypothetical protein n=1 Tax=Streptomyces sp. NPDC092307 TaxID=3366013 RepID=UPI00382816DB